MPNQFCYEVNIGAWHRLAELLTKEELDSRLVVESFVDCFETLLSIDRKLLEAAINRSTDKAALQDFLDVWDTATKNAIDALKDEFVDEYPINHVSDFLGALKASATPQELLALAKYLSDSTAEEGSVSHLAAATVVTDSIKDLIKKFSKKKWLEHVLKAINEVLKLIRGV